ncbi:hypothetical protein B0H14DRAFT_2717359 [Mycena olivaceomarginata]|nr:hypothetical protein B0H14DRAFT_2717359 [Mycena olivaceomarginata]
MQSRYHLNPTEEIDVNINCAPPARTLPGVPPPSLTPPRLGLPLSDGSISLALSICLPRRLLAFIHRPPLHLSSHQIHIIIFQNHIVSHARAIRWPRRATTFLSGSARHALGPLIDAVHGVCAVEHKWGSGGWVRSVVLDREVVLDSATGFAGYGCGGAGRRRGILPMGLGSGMRVADIRRWRRGQAGTRRVVASRTGSLGARRMGRRS